MKKQERRDYVIVYHTPDTEPVFYMGMVDHPWPRRYIADWRFTDCNPLTLSSAKRLMKLKTFKDADIRIAPIANYPKLQVKYANI